jgi:hypothetical protein
MIIDKILEIGIDEKERLFIKPQVEQFEFIYRDASGVIGTIRRKYFIHPNRVN